MRSEVATFALALFALAACSPRDVVAARERGAPDASDVGPDLCIDANCDEANEDCVRGTCIPKHPSLRLAFAINDLCSVTAGRLACFGSNASGQLGVGDTDPRDAPVTVGDATDWIEVTSAIGEHLCGLRSGGRLFCWGANGKGNLGLGDTDVRSVPTEQVSSAGAWRSTHAGSGHTCARDERNALHCWGRNEDGELGTGDLENRWSPREVEGIRAARVAVGWGHTCIVAPNGRLACWGRNVEGQLGLGDREIRTTPTWVGEDHDWKEVRSQGTHTCGIRESGRLYCWGANADGQLGVGDARDRLEPTQIGPERRWTVVSPALYRTCAIAEEGSLHCWGALSLELFGVPDSTDALVPQQVGAATDWVDVRTGYADVCAARRDGSLACWGRSNPFGFGDGDPRRDPPVELDFGR